MRITRGGTELWHTVWATSVATVLMIGQCVSLGGCANTTQEQAMSDQQTTTLQDRIDEVRAGFAARADDATKALYEDGVDDVLRQGVLDSAVNVGDSAPAFVLPNASGQDVALASLLTRGPVVLVWYRGGWCPYCNLTLRAFQERLDEITGLGATLVAISPERPDNALSTKEKSDLAFEVLSDQTNVVAKRYGVVFSLTDSVHKNYDKNFGFDAWNGQDSGELPLAATYVIDTAGRVTYAFLHHDYRERAEPQVVVDALRDTVR